MDIISVVEMKSNILVRKIYRAGIYNDPTLF